jgi:hypothetical protein
MVVTKLRWAVEARRSKDIKDVRNILERAGFGSRLELRGTVDGCTRHDGVTRRDPQVDPARLMRGSVVRAYP